MNQFSHAYRSLKQTGGSTNYPWTTILVINEIELLRNEFSESQILRLTYQVIWAIRIDESDVLGNFNCFRHYFLLLPSKYVKVQIVYGYLLEAVPIINLHNSVETIDTSMQPFPGLGCAKHVFRKSCLKSVKRMLFITMGTNCAPLIADFYFAQGRDFMASLSEDKEAEIIQAYNSTSRYLNDP